VARNRLDRTVAYCGRDSTADGKAVVMREDVAGTTPWTSARVRAFDWLLPFDRTQSSGERAGVV